MNSSNKNIHVLADLGFKVSLNKGDLQRLEYQHLKDLKTKISNAKKNLRENSTKHGGFPTDLTNRNQA